jgi:hypothetical protein
VDTIIFYTTSAIEYTCSKCVFNATGTYKGTNTGLEIIERRNVHFDPIPIPYGQILPYLIQKGMVEPRTLNPVQPPYPPGYDENATCDYHAEII